MSTIEILEHITEMQKQLLDICLELIKITEMHDLLSESDAQQVRGEIERLKGQVVECTKI